MKKTMLKLEFLFKTLSRPIGTKFTSYGKPVNRFTYAFEVMKMLR